MSESNALSVSFDTSIRRRASAGSANGTEVANTVEPTHSPTVNAPEQPAAIVSKTLARFSAGERSSNEMRSQTEDLDASSLRYPPSQPATHTAANTGSHKVGQNTDYIVAQIQAQFSARAEIAVLAQANQMPNQAMPFSSIV